MEVEWIFEEDEKKLVYKFAFDENQRAAVKVLVGERLKEKFKHIQKPVCPPYKTKMIENILNISVVRVSNHHYDIVEINGVCYKIPLPH